MGRLRVTGALLLAALVLLAGAVGCSEPALGAVTDDHGREVQLDGIPTRIVSHVPSITETLFALGLGDSVVGVSDFCNFPEEASEKPSVGGYYTPSIEQIAALDPDVVLTDGYAADITKLDALDIPYVVLDPADIDGYLANIDLLGNITGAQEEANALILEIEESIDAVVARVAGADPPRVFYVFDATELSKPWTAGPGSFVDAFMALAGGANVAGEAQEPWLQFSMEALVDADPEVILVDAQMGTATAAPEALERDPVWQETTAVREGRISVIDGDLVNRHGPRMVLALEEMARVFHPELFQ
jgi:iron complex transport system substrate-binding protein